MNFQAIDQANGNNVTIWATMTEHLGVTQKDGKLKLKCKLKDDNGVTHNAHIHKGNGELPGTEHLEKRMEFSLSTFQGTYNGQPYTGYSGFWSHGAATSAPQNTQQAPSPPAQGTNYHQPAPQVRIEPDWDAIAEGKVRHGILCAMLQGGISVDYSEVLRHTVFVMTGIDPDSVPSPDSSIQEPKYQANPNWIGDSPEPPPDDSQIPF